MEWIEVFVETTQEGLELVSGFLYQCGLTGLMIEDARDFEVFLENPHREWDYIEDGLLEEKKNQKTGITFFLRENSHGREQLLVIQNGLKYLKVTETEFDLGSLVVTLKNIKEEDWANNWKKYFKPFEVGNKIMIKPSWEELTQSTDKLVLNIDPGHIFGTGTHETTQLCIELIETYIKDNDKILDIGCGSGILSIASLLLGAKSADAVDIDPNAVEIVYENAKRNGIKETNYFVEAGNILEDEKLHQKYSGNEYDIIEANIVADVIIALLEQIPYYIKKNGTFIASGIIQQRLEDVYKALDEKGFQVIDTKFKKDWVAIASKFVGKCI